MYRRMVSIALCFSAALLLASCGDTGIKRSREFKGKIYFESNRFDGESYLENTGTCYYDGKKVHKFNKDKWDPKVSRDGKKLVVFNLVNGRIETGEFTIIDLSSKDEVQYHIPVGVLNFEWMPDNKRLGFVGKEKLASGEKIWNIYIFDPEKNELKKITNNKIPRIFINSFSFSPDGKRIVYGIPKSQKDEEGRIVKVIDVNTGETRDLPFSSGNVAWSPDGKTIVISGISITGGKRDIGKHRIMFYDAGSETYEKIDKPGGENAYQWVEDLCYSPDGKKIAFIRVENSGAKSLWMMDADGSNRELLVYDGYQIDSISWGE